MLPDSHNEPPFLPQSPVRICVPDSVPLKLRAPPLCIPLGRSPMLGTAVPEAAVDEYGYPRPDEDEIRLPP
jgi:hypothetical protein